MSVRAAADPAAFRAAFARVPPRERDAWVDAELALGAVPDDGPELPRGCVPYLPCPVDAVARALERAEVGEGDVLVDVGAGIGRAAFVAHLLTGAAVVGVEIQPALARAARAHAARLGLARVLFVEGDAARVTGPAADGTVFFLYCPFSGARLDALLDDLERLDRLPRARPLRVCCVDVPLPPRPWLALVPPADGDLAVYQSTRA